MRYALPFLAALFVFGCAHDAAPTATEGARAQRLAPVSQLTGVWTSSPRYTVNRWQVVLHPEGELSVDGPGVRASGAHRLGLEGGEGRLEPGGVPVKFERDPASGELVFQIGNDVPVRLVRTGT